MLRKVSFFALAICLVACGGSGAVTSDICSATLYQPNYATAPNLTLRKWNHLPINVFFATVTTINSTTIEQHLRDGFTKWNAALSRTLWTEVFSPANADLVVTVQASSPQTTLASTTVHYSSGSDILTSAQMTIYTWSALPESTYDPTGCHELGHALGIGGHSPSNLDIMYFQGNATGQLTTSDINTLRTAYCDFASKAVPKSQTNGPDRTETEIYPGHL